MKEILSNTRKQDAYGTYPSAIAISPTINGIYCRVMEDFVIYFSPIHNQEPFNSKEPF